MPLTSLYQSLLTFAYKTTYASHQRHPYLGPSLAFAGLQIIVVSALFTDSATRPLLFWYCNCASFFFAIAFFGNNFQLVKGISYVGILTQLLWIADFLSQMVGLDVSDTADYIFEEGLTFQNDVSILIHFAIPLIALMYSAHRRPELRSVGYAFVFACGLYFATIAGTQPIDDINCVYFACTAYTDQRIILLWPLLIALSIGGGYLLHLLLYRIVKRYRVLHSSFIAI